MQDSSAGLYEPRGCDVLLVEDLGQQRLPARALAAVLRRAGFAAQLTHFGPVSSDAVGEASAIVALAGQLQPRLVLLSILFASRVPEFLDLAGALRGAGARAHITMAGPLPSFAPDELLAACPSLDSVLCGEAEASVAELAAGSSDPTRWPAVPGLAFRTQNGAIRTANHWPAPVTDLDSLPFPVHDEALPSYLGYGFATVEGSRGCYHACSFCLPSAFYRSAARGCDDANDGAPVAGDDSRDPRRCTPRHTATEVATPMRAKRARSQLDYRLRSVGNLVDEIEALYRQGARLFLFDDEQFLPPEPLRARRIAQLERELARRNLEIAFTIKCRADDVEAGLFRQLRRMGLLRVYVGIESGCPTSLDLFGKRIEAERNLEALATLENLGIVADFYDLLFHPWSTLETVEADIAFCQRATSHISSPLRFTETGILPGTGMARRLQTEGRYSGEPWSRSYELVDPRVEVLRRLNRLIFGASGPRASIDSRLTEAWYALLLEQRFQRARNAGALAGKLRNLVAWLNLDWLVVWSEMVEFARTGPILDAGRVNDAASCWATRVNASCMRAAAILAELGLPGQASIGTEVVPSC
jgi:radical SAM superfamily enzyme YgiQ (UPF0313 family)